LAHRAAVRDRHGRRLTGPRRTVWSELAQAHAQNRSPASTHRWPQLAPGRSAPAELRQP